jgi:DNA end-binding protein Ku
MEGKGVTALGRVVMNKRERVIALEPFGKGLLGTTLHYAYEVRKADDYFDDIPDVKISNEMLKLAEHIVESKAGDFEPASFVDHYEEAVVELIRKKQAHEPVKKGTVSTPKNVVNLMDALRRSAANDSSAKPKQPKKASKRIAGQKEMLLSIPGKKRDAKEATKPAARRKTG